MKSTLQFRMKKVLCLAVAAGPVRTTDDGLVHNILSAVSFLASLLQRDWQSVQALHVKSPSACTASGTAEQAILLPLKKKPEKYKKPAINPSHLNRSTIFL